MSEWRSGLCGHAHLPFYERRKIMGRIMLATSASTDEEYGGNIEPVVTSGEATIQITVNSTSYITWVKKGNVVDVEISLDGISGVGSTDVIATGLPKAVYNTTKGYAFKRIVNGTDGGVDARVLLQNNGNEARLVNYYGRRIEDGKSYEGNFMYIAE